MASAWTKWARSPQLDDDFWGFHLQEFLQVVPEPRGLTLDLAAGEGRVSRELRRHRHRVVAIDSSLGLTQAAADHPGAAAAAVADVGLLPFRANSFDLVVAFMCLHDFDDVESAMREVRRVLATQGVVVAALLHPSVTAAMAGSYEQEATYESMVERGGQSMVYRGRHRPTETYLSLLDQHGLELHVMRDVADPRTPERPVKFLHLGAVKV